MTRTARLLGTAAGLALLSGIVLSYSGVLAAKVSVSWSYDYAQQPPCSMAQTKDCIDHFEILDYTNSQKPKLLRTVANPPGAVGKVDHISDSFTYGPPFGLRTLVVVTVARGKNGDILASNPFAARKDVEIRPRLAASRH